MAKEQRIEVTFGYSGRSGAGERFGDGLTLSWFKDRLRGAEGPVEQLKVFRDQLRSLADEIQETLNDEELPPE